jgi:peptidyl-Asp metalloendopeptidase
MPMARIHQHPLTAIGGLLSSRHLPVVLFSTMLGAQQPLLLPVDPVPAASAAWNAQERAANPMLTESAFVRVDVAALRALAPAGSAVMGSFALDLFEQSHVLDVRSVRWTLGYQVFSGSLRGAASEVHLTVAPDGTTAGLIHVGAESFVVAYSSHADVHVLQRYEQALVPAHMGCGVDHTHAVAAPAGALLPESTNLDCGKTTIDVAVFYTPLARQNAGGTSAMEATVVGAIAQANQGHATSGVPMEFRLVWMAETNYVETGSSNDLSRFRGTSDSYMTEVHGLRDTYGADLMHLITNPASPQFCGVASLMTTLSTGFASSSFAVTVRTCIPNHTFTHEAGHNMGCHHDFANAGPALFPYSYGHRTPDSAYRTIMAYSPGTRVNVWSSPSVTYQGYVMGVAGNADNALSATNAASTVSQFRPTRVPLWCDLNGGIPGALGAPVLTGKGTLDQAIPMELSITNYQPGMPGVLIVGASAVNVPLFGGLLVPSLDVALSISGTGSAIVHDASWLALQPPGFEAWFQAAFLDVTAPEAIAASDGVKVVVP